MKDMCEQNEKFDFSVDDSLPSYAEASHIGKQPQAANQIKSSDGPRLQNYEARQPVSNPVPMCGTSDIIAQPIFRPVQTTGSPTQQYPMVYYYSPTSAQQTGDVRPCHQEPNVLFLAGNGETADRHGQTKRGMFLWPILLSCFVIWFCGFIIGSIAFMLIIFGQDAAYRGKHAHARRYAKVSLGVSLVGIFIGALAIFVLCSVFRPYLIRNQSSCLHGHYLHDGKMVCCGSVSCSHGVHVDSTGCLQCCEVYSRSDCYLNGYFNDSHGCKTCCAQNKESCKYGSYYDSYGCAVCCDNVSSYSCSEYGYYNDSNGCKKCCDLDFECRLSFSIPLDYILDANGCRRCCISNVYFRRQRQCQYGSFYKTSTCKVCCLSRTEHANCTG